MFVARHQTDAELGRGRRLRLCPVRGSQLPQGISVDLVEEQADGHRPKDDQNHSAFLRQDQRRLHHAALRQNSKHQRVGNRVVHFETVEGKTVRCFASADEVPFVRADYESRGCEADDAAACSVFEGHPHDAHGDFPEDREQERHKRGTDFVVRFYAAASGSRHRSVLEEVVAVFPGLHTERTARDRRLEEDRQIDVG